MTHTSDIVVLYESFSIQNSLFEELNLLSESKPRLCVLDIEICGAKSTDRSNPAHDFLDSLDMGTLAARASQAVSTLKVITLAINTAGARVSHWTCGKTRQVTPISSKDRADSIIDSIVSPLLQGSSFIVRILEPHAHQLSNRSVP